MVKRISGVNKLVVEIDYTYSSEVGATYDPDVHKFFKMKCVGDTLYFQYSTDGFSWNNIVNPIEDVDINTDQVRVDIRNFEENDNEEIMTVDNLNIPVTPEVGESYPLPSFSVV